MTVLPVISSDISSTTFRLSHAGKNLCPGCSTLPNAVFWLCGKSRGVLWNDRKLLSSEGVTLLTSSVFNLQRKAEGNVPK